MADYSIQELFQEYIIQRNSGNRPEASLKLIIQLQPNLPSADRQKLAQSIRQWELKKQQGIPYELPEAMAVEATPTAEDLENTSPYIPKSPPAVAQAGITCPHCGKFNPPDAQYCYACGQLLAISSSQTGVLAMDEIEDPSVFGNMATLLIYVQGYEAKPLRLQVGDGPLIIGRSDPNAALEPDIDLSPYGAKNMGVSRQHATLQRANLTLTLLDEGSVNHTFINGVKVHPHEVRVVRDGDEVRFGQLITRFTFQREVRRLG